MSTLRGPEISLSSSPCQVAASRLAAELDQVASEWLVRVCNDQDLVVARELTREQLIDFVPALLRELVHSLRGELRTDLSLDRLARVHASQRLGLGYPVDDILAELDHLNQSVLFALAISRSSVAAAFIAASIERAKAVARACHDSTAH